MTVSSDQVDEARTCTDRKGLISVHSHFFVSGATVLELDHTLLDFKMLVEVKM